MKISKLFHWLYGLVMLLPIFAIGVSCLITTFNMSAKEEANIIYKYDTNEVNSLDDLRENNIYHFTFDFQNAEIGNLFVANSIYNIKGYENYIISAEKTNSNYIRVYKSATNTILFIDGWNSTIFSLTNFNSNIQCDLVFKDIQFEDSYTNYSRCENIPIVSVETHNVEPQDVFYKSLDKVTQSLYFNWAYDSFLVAPFSYIVALFSMPSNSPVVMLMSYWLAISIIWLVFDLVMYVPLLVHRWLDKGAIE